MSTNSGRRLRHYLSDDRDLNAGQQLGITLAAVSMCGWRLSFYAKIVDLSEKL